MSGSVIVIGGLAESLVNFRGDLLKALKASGLEVTTASAPTDNEELLNELNDMGIKFIPLSLQRNGLNPIKDLGTLFQCVKLFISKSPTYVLAYTIKPVIWGGIAARLARADGFIPLITGLGFAFQGDSFKRRVLTRLVRFLYRAALKNSSAVIFQNEDNAREFVKQGIIKDTRCFIVNGSGINTEKFRVMKLPDLDTFTFLCVARLLSEKGLREYNLAAEIVKSKYPDVKFQLVGPSDTSPDGIALDEVKSWQGVDYLGETKDVRPFLADCTVYVLPSYHEGIPRSTLEAMSMGRPVITTKAVGCKETVVDGVNGLLVEVACVEDLARKMIWCIENNIKLAEMGRNSRRLAEEKFDVNQVNDRIMSIMGAK